MSNYSVGRNPMVAKGINWLALSTGGALFFVNIHASALAMQVVAQNGGAGTFIPMAANGDFIGVFSRYATAFAVSLVCLLISGCFLHPRGLPTVFNELRSIEARGVSKSLAMGATCLVVGLLAYGGYWAYRYDLLTTSIAFGVSNLFSTAAFPVWLNVVGPEFLFHGTHFYGRLNAARPAAVPSMPGMPPGAIPGATVAQAPGMPSNNGVRPWALRKP